MKKLQFLKLKKFKKISVLIVTALLLISPVGSLINDSLNGLHFTARENRTDDYELNIHFLDVGVADCIIIESDFGNYMIDGGTPEYSEEIYAKLVQLGINNLDAIFISHPDFDHYSGLDKVISEIDIGKIYTSSRQSDDYNYQNFLKSAENIGFSILEKSDIIEDGDLIFEVLSPSKEYKSDNDMSLVLKLKYKDFELLFTGDIEEEAIEDLLNNDIDCDVLKISHHGSANGTSEELLNAVSPEIAVISTAKGRYDFPDQKVIDLLNTQKIEYYQTDIHGKIIISTNGTGELTVSTKG